MVYGCKKAKKDIRDYKVKKRASAISLPNSFELQPPRVKNQGEISSCVAHVASSILEYYSDKKLSTNFIYGMDGLVCGDKEPGMYLNNACKVMQKYGDALESDCPGNDEYPFCDAKANAVLINQTKLDAASQYKILQYFNCVGINNIKYALYCYGPVMGAIEWYDNYRVINGYLEFDTLSEKGYHCILIYGWNEKGFLIQNSWGNRFGKNGRCVLPYKYTILEAKAIIDDPNIGHDIAKTPALLKSKIIYKPINFILNLFNH